MQFMDLAEPAAAAAASAVIGTTYDDQPIPMEVNQTALALLMIQLRHQQDCTDKQLAMVPCDERQLYRGLMGYGFLIVFCLALIGNCLNLFIYNSDQIRFYIAIRMLCTKLLMNTLMMVFLVPQALRVVNLWEPGSQNDMIYWKFWPYQAYFINIFGFCAMWLTVLMTAECYLHVFFPSHSKSVCTKRNLSRSYILMGISAMILALIYPLNRTVSMKRQCSSVLVTIVASQSGLMNLFERVHTVSNLLLAILIPLALLVFMTFSIVWRLLIRPPDLGSGSHFNVEKQTVTRITLITTLLQLVTETPSVPVFIYAGIFGPNIVHQSGNLCAWQTVSHFLGLCNASLSFFVYIAFSARFRKTMFCRAQNLLHACCPRLIGSYPSTPKMRTYASYMSHGSHHSRSEKHNGYGLSPSPISCRSGANSVQMSAFPSVAMLEDANTSTELLRPSRTASSSTTQSSCSQFDTFL